MRLRRLGQTARANKQTRQGHSKIDRGRETGGMKSEELGPSLLAAFAHVPDMHSPCAPDSGRPVHIRFPTAPQAVLYVPARRDGAGEMPAHTTSPSRLAPPTNPRHTRPLLF